MTGSGGSGRRLCTGLPPAPPPALYSTDLYPEHRLCCSPSCPASEEAAAAAGPAWGEMSGPSRSTMRLTTPNTWADGSTASKAVAGSTVSHSFESQQLLAESRYCRLRWQAVHHQAVHHQAVQHQGAQNSFHPRRNTDMLMRQKPPYKRNRYLCNTLSATVGLLHQQYCRFHDGRCQSCWCQLTC